MRATAQAVAEATVQAAAEAATQPRAALATAVRPPVRPPALDAVDTQRPDPVVSPSQPAPRRRPTALFGIHVGQVITWQLVIIGVLFAIPQPLAILIPVSLAGLVLLGLTAVRPRGRWLYEWFGLWLRYITRRRRVAVPAGKDAAIALLGSVLRGGQLQTLEIEGAKAALVVHAGGMTVLVETMPASRELIVDASPAIPPLTVLLPLGEEGEPVISAQIVVSTVPAPGPLDQKSPAVLSYRSLGRGMVPAHRRSWIALQALRTADDHDDVALRAALSNAVSRLQRRLRKAKLRGHVLDHDRSVADLLSLSRLDARPGKGANATAPEIHESWNSWSTGRETQTAFRLLDWPDLASPAGPDFVDRLITVPTLSTTVSVAARRQGDEVELEAAVRIVLPDTDTIESTTEEIATIASSYSARVQRLDGEQVFGVAASLPLGGFLL